MEPALHPGQLALLHRDYYRTRPLERGQIVAFRWQGRVYVKRVYAVAGDAVLLLCQDGYCIPVDGSERSRALRMVRRTPAFQVRCLRVPPGRFFSLGDHLTVSIDSRDLGPIPTGAILGRVQPL